MIQGVFQTCVSKAFGHTTNWCKVGNKVKVLAYTIRGWQWIDMTVENFMVNYRVDN